MKKEYSKPTANVIEFAKPQLLAGSGETYNMDFNSEFEITNEEDIL